MINNSCRLVWVGALAGALACLGGCEANGGGYVGEEPMDAGPVIVPDVPVVDVNFVAVPGLKSFPGAEGFGAEATGGRGGRVIYVTNLSFSGPGSLNDALAQTGKRYILFRVSGLINGSAYIRKGDVTIAGQTSPGGIILRGIYTGEENYCGNTCPANTRGQDNVIVRYLRSRPSEGDAGNAEQDALRVRFARNIILDHLSIGNAIDEAVEISSSNRVTIMNTLLAETIGSHAERGGMLMNYSNPAAGYALDQITIIRSVWNRLMGRYPEMSRESPAAANSTLRIELSNNLIWDQQFYIDAAPTNGLTPFEGSPVFYQLNWAGNLGYARRTYRYAMINFPTPSMSRSSAWFHDDHLNLYPDRSDYQLQYCCSDFAMTRPPATMPTWGRAERHDFPDVTYIPSEELRQHLVENVGCFPRDPMDRRLMGPVSQGTILETTLNVNPARDAWRFDWTTAPTPPRDTDLDGMPDEWERAHGLNPNAQDHNGQWLSRELMGTEGYTNLECYLEELARTRRTERPFT